MIPTGLLFAFLAGLAGGLVLAAPVGPIGALAAYQAAGKHMRAAWLLGLGACTGDSLLALLATWGAELPVPVVWLHGLLAIVMLGLATYLWMTAKRPVAAFAGTAGLGVGLMATILHPANLLAFGVLFGWMHNQGIQMETAVERGLVTLGVFSGAVVVWAGVIQVSLWAGETMSIKKLQVRLKQGVACLCLVAGLVALGSLAGTF